MSATVAPTAVDGKPFVSVVTVSLNSAATIEATLASVALQEAPFGIEHVCVDGGSRDGTREIIECWAARSGKLRRIFEPDSGIFDAMNKGLRASRGEYVLYLNADDFLLAPHILGRAMHGLMPGAAGNPGIVAGDVRMGRADDGYGVWRHRRVPRMLAQVRGTGFFPLHQGMFAQRELLEAVGGFDAALRLAADVNQFYDIERLHRPSIRLLGFDIAFMRSGGAANAGLRSMIHGSLEIYRHLRRSHGVARAGVMLASKTLQSVSEVRYGRPDYRPWMSGASSGGAVTGEQEVRLDGPA